MLESGELQGMLAALFEASLDCVIVMDEAGTVLALNPAAERTFGYSREEALGRELAALIVPEHLRAAHARGLANYIAGAEPKYLGRRVEAEALCKAGHIVPVELAVTEIVVAGRRCFAATMRDLSQREEPEKVEQMRRQLELAVEGAELGVWSFNPRTGISWYSDRVKEIVGLEDNFLTDGEAFRQRVHPDDRDQLFFDRTDGFPDGPVAAEYRVVRPDGAVRWLHSLGAVERNDEGEVEAVHGVIIDITERKQAEDELGSTRRQLELAVQGGQLGAWTFEFANQRTWYSDRSKEIYGLPRETEVTTETLRASIHPDDWEKVAYPYLSGYIEDRVEVEYRVICPDGSVRWVYSLGTAERDADGTARRVSGIHLDITDRKRAETELEEARRQLELAVDGAQLGIWTVNPQTGATWYSDRSRNLWGVDHELNLDAKMMRQYIHPEDWEKVLEPYRLDFPGDRVAFEHRVVWPNGDVRWVQSIGTALRDENGVVHRLSGIHLDITERKRSEAELNEARRQLDLAVEGAKLGNWTIDPHTGEALFSQRSRALYGISHDGPLTAAELKRHIHPDDWRKVIDPYLIGFPADTMSIEHRVVWPSGEIRWIHSLGTAVRDETGTVTHVSGIHLDITDRKRAEEELARSHDALNQSEKLSAMGALLAGVSHELNNPLAAIVGQAEMLEEDSRGTTFEARARKISSAAERCARIVQTFLAMARQKAPQKEMVDMNDLVSSALEITDYGLRTAGVAVRVTFGTSLPPVEGDRDQLHQVLVNLILNALQAMEGGEQFDKTLTIRTSVSQAGAVLVDVCDTGPGVPEPVRGRLFEPFFTTKPQGVGTGVGLSFSLGIVQSHRGTLTLEPSRRGAHFRITLPPGTETQLIAVQTEKTQPRQEGGRALVVEDEGDVAETLRELLEREGYAVTVARDGSDALMALDREDFDLIVSDLRMPGVSGPDLHARLAETKPHLLGRMGFVTGDTLGSSMGDFLRGCGRPVLEKPFTRTGVRCLIASIAGAGEAA